MYFTTDEISRFWSKVDRRNGRDCWSWLAAKTGDGYGQFKTRGKQELAHRVSYTICNRPPPNGWVVCHTCDTPSCVNPQHLFCGTASDNMKDCARKGRNIMQTNPERHWNAVKTHCKRGHPFRGENLGITHNGRRYCRSCNKENMRAYRARNSRKIA